MQVAKLNLVPRLSCALRDDNPQYGIKMSTAEEAAHVARTAFQASMGRLCWYQCDNTCARFQVQSVVEMFREGTSATLERRVSMNKTQVFSFFNSMWQGGKASQGWADGRFGQRKPWWFFPWNSRCGKTSHIYRHLAIVAVTLIPWQRIAARSGCNRAVVALLLFAANIVNDKLRRGEHLR